MLKPEQPSNRTTPPQYPQQCGTPSMCRWPECRCEGCGKEFHDWLPHIVTEDDCWLCEGCADVE